MSIHQLINVPGQRLYGSLLHRLCSRYWTKAIVRGRMLDTKGATSLNQGSLVFDDLASLTIAVVVVPFDLCLALPEPR
jgi:hypothetical protein